MDIPAIMPRIQGTSAFDIRKSPSYTNQQKQNSYVILGDITFTSPNADINVQQLVLEVRWETPLEQYSFGLSKGIMPHVGGIFTPTQTIVVNIVGNVASLPFVASSHINVQQAAVEETPKKYLSLSEALKLEEEIYSNLKAEKERARQAEAEYWQFLDEYITED